MHNRENSAFLKLDLPMIPVTGNARMLGDEFFLGDNLEEGIIEEVDISRFLKSPVPFKMDFLAIIVCLDGMMRIKLNLQEYVLGKNDVLVVTPGSVGECIDYGYGNECKIVSIMSASANNGDKESFSSMMRMRRFLLKHAVFHVSDSVMSDLVQVYGLMRREIEHNDSEYTSNILRSYMKVLIYNIAQWVADASKSMSRPVQNRAQQLFDRFMELVQDNYSRHREISYYAGLLCVSPKYMSQVILQVSGRYAGEWIKDYVILEAKALLKSGRYTVQQVSIELNFSNASFFGKYFKKAVGMSPRKYMEE